MKIIKYVAAAAWLAFCIYGIVSNYSHYGPLEYVVVIIVTILPFFIYFIIKSHQKKKNRETLENPTSQQYNEPTYISSIPAEKANTSVEYIIGDNTISRADGALISDEEVPYLIELSKKRAIENAAKQPKRSYREEELAFQFFYKHGSESQRCCDEFLNLNRDAYNETDINKKIELLQKAIISYEKAKQWHYKHSKGGEIHFQDYWECMHNSRNSCFGWDESVREELEFQIEKRDIIIPWILENSKKGFMQPEIYKRFPNISQSVLRKNIDELIIQNEDLAKTKKGSSYFITQKSNELSVSK